MSPNKFLYLGGFQYEMIDSQKLSVGEAFLI